MKSLFIRPDTRSVEEKNHYTCYLKFKVPFFDSFDKELVAMICDKLEYRTFRANDISNCPYMTSGSNAEGRRRRLPVHPVRG